jgi:hypothetical protein
LAAKIVGVADCTSVESSGESKFDLLDSEYRATIDRHNLGAVEVTTTLAGASGWSSLKYARRR